MVDSIDDLWVCISCYEDIADGNVDVPAEGEGAHWVLGTGERTFSPSDCDRCLSSLCGSRHEAGILIPVKKAMLHFLPLIHTVQGTQAPTVCGASVPWTQVSVSHKFLTELAPNPCPLCLLVMHTHPEKFKEEE